MNIFIKEMLIIHIQKFLNLQSIIYHLLTSISFCVFIVTLKCDVLFLVVLYIT